jgi:hypothetical protein
MEEVTVSLTNESRVEKSGLEKVKMLHGKEVSELK